MIDALIITTNVLLVLVTIVASLVTLADVNKEEQLTLREVFAEAIRGPKKVQPPVEHKHTEAGPDA